MRYSWVDKRARIGQKILAKRFLPIPNQSCADSLSGHSLDIDQETLWTLCDLVSGSGPIQRVSVPGVTLCLCTRKTTSLLSAEWQHLASPLQAGARSWQWPHRGLRGRSQGRAVQCSAVQCSAVQCRDLAVAGGRVVCVAPRHQHQLEAAVQCSAVQCSAVHCSEFYFKQASSVIFLVNRHGTMDFVILILSGASF
jgi:hypothetical protein